MKRNSIIALILILGIILISSYFLFFQNTTNSEEELSQSDLIKNVFPIMETYCQNLNSQVIHSACPTCRNQMTDCEFVEESEFENGQDVCLLKKIGDDYSLSISRHLIYGRNTRMGYVTLDFTLDEKGNIISQNLPEMPCL
jgi:hypothetical protein